ncbi:MAG: cupin domain-containing protein [Thermanaerothrix sp.]|nr:cupin domain-containing protein [Thermanaerothrix sp.]
MIKRFHDMTPVRRENLQGGQGGAWNRYAIAPHEELPGSHFRMVGTIRLDPGAEVGEHEHLTNEELYVILEGEGVYVEDGTEYKVGPGDVLMLQRTHSHAIRNTGKGALTFLAVIVD